MSESTRPQAFAGLELFILFGQSNMSGSAPIEAQDREVDERVECMVQYDCPAHGLSYGEWIVARPPLHGCQWLSPDTGLGPGDSFAKVLARAWPSSRIGLIPCAVPGVSIDYFEKGSVSQAKPYQALPRGYQSGYQMMLDRALVARERGRIRGILFHQGESDFGQREWVDKVASVVDNLRRDLGLSSDVPFIAGELPPTGCCGAHNTLMSELPSRIANATVVSARGTSVYDEYHWDSASVRRMGRRYAEEFLQLVPHP